MQSLQFIVMEILHDLCSRQLLLQPGERIGGRASSYDQLLTGRIVTEVLDSASSKHHASAPSKQPYVGYLQAFQGRRPCREDDRGDPSLT